MEKITFKIRKKAFKDTLAIAKRVVPKKTGISVMIAKGKEVFVYSKTEKIEVFDYVDLLEETQPFVFKFDPTLVDKWLDKADRDMDFELLFETTKDKASGEDVVKTFLHCVEKKKKLEVSYVEPPDDSFVDMRNKDFKQFKNKEAYLSTLNEANKSFQKSERTYSDYAKLTDINLFVFDPHFFSVFRFIETTGIMDMFGNEGIAVHKEAIDNIVKSVKKPKDFTHCLTDKALYLREVNTVYAIRFSNDIRFPDYRSIKPAKDQKKTTFIINADQMNEILKGFPNSEITKVILDSNDSYLIEVTPDKEEFDSASFDNEIYASDEEEGGAVADNGEFMPRSVFQNQVLKSFFEGLTGVIQVEHVFFNSKTTKKDFPNYFWIYKGENKSKIMPGIIEAQGFLPNKSDHPNT